MYIGFYNYYKVYNRNKMLIDPSSPIGDNLMYSFVLLSQKLKKLGHQIGTIDTDDIKKFDAIVFVEFPGLKNAYLKKLIKSGFTNLYLIIFESPIIKPDNYKKENHAYFKKVFTWSDELIDNPSINSGQAKKYFKINYSHQIPAELNISLWQKEILCTMISSNKSMRHPKELYTERIKAIRWFENNHPGDFDLYGKGWDKYNFQGKILGINTARLNRLTFLTKLLKLDYPSYKGEVSSKLETYKKYKFSICYENIRDFMGYITEKIFDCFFGACVPVYWGAENITDYIPENTFINKKSFDTYEKLYDYLKQMPDKKYANYLHNIGQFLKSEKAYPFSAECFSNTLIREIV